MFRNIEAAFLGNELLTSFDFFIEEFLDPPAIETYQMIVVRAFIQLEYRLAGFKMITMQQAGLLELREHAIDGRQTDIHIFSQQNLIDVLGAQMAHRTILKNL